MNKQEIIEAFRTGNIGEAVDGLMGHRSLRWAVLKEDEVLVLRAPEDYAGRELEHLHAEAQKVHGRIIVVPHNWGVDIVSVDGVRYCARCGVSDGERWLKGGTWLCRACLEHLRGLDLRWIERGAHGVPAVERFTTEDLCKCGHTLDVHSFGTQCDGRKHTNIGFVACPCIAFMKAEPTPPKFRDTPGG